MKKLKITIIATLLSFSATSQIIIKTEGTEIILPKTAKKVLKSGIITNEDETVTITKGGDYECEGLFITFNYTKLDGNKDFLIDIKKSKENRRNRLKLNDKYYETKLDTINKNIVLIGRNKADGFNYHDFYMVDKNFTYSVTGMLEYDDGEEVKAKTILAEILKTIKFIL